jgi:hypothetical protein
MDKEITSSSLSSGDFPRRIKLSSREIGVAVALTFAAAIQLLSSISSRESKSGVIDGSGHPASFIQPARQG